MSTDTLTNAATTNIDAFLEATTPDIDTLEAAVGAAIARIDMRALAMVYGAPNTGKSTLLALIRETTSSYAANNQLWLPGRIGQACRALGAACRIVTVDDFAPEGAKAKAMLASMVAHEYVDFQHNDHPLMVTLWKPQLFLAGSPAVLDMPLNAPLAAAGICCPNVVAQPDRQLLSTLWPEAAAWADRCIAKAQALAARQ